MAPIPGFFPMPRCLGDVMQTISPLDPMGLYKPKLTRWHSNECKRRKIKCNGQVPCQRCGHLNLECMQPSAATSWHNS